MTVKVRVHPLLAKPKRYMTSSALVVLAVGLAGSALSAISAAQRSQDLMLSRATAAAGALPASDIKKLSGHKDDLGNPTYEDLKRRLIRIRQDNASMRTVYLLGQRDGQVFYYVDSESETSAGYAQPGLFYTETTTRLQAAFTEDTAYLEGPSRDGFGTRISAIAPVVNETTGQTVAMLGIDVDAYDYYLQIFTYTVIPLLLAAIPLMVLVRNRRLEAKEQEVLQLKTQFVSVASHELRSPLTGALWGVQSLIKPGTNANLHKAQRDTLAAVYTNTATSLASVNEILDFSIFDRNKADKLHRVEVDLKAVLSDVVKLLGLSAQEADVTIRYKSDWPDNIMTIGDPGALKRAFSNILSNAIKYSRKGTAIELSYRLDGGHHTIAVKDHGIGIPAGEQAKVLEGYYRATNASRQLAHGTGMGLWVTKLIIEQHDGKLKLTSQVNKGTTVFASLPKRQP